MAACWACRSSRGRGTRHAFFSCGAGMVLVFNASETRAPAGDPALPVPVHGAEGAGHICFAASAAELDQWVARFGAAGVAIEADFRWPNGARSVYVRDPAGNSVEFAGLWGPAADDAADDGWPDAPATGRELI